MIPDLATELMQESSSGMSTLLILAIVFGVLLSLFIKGQEA